MRGGLTCDGCGGPFPSALVNLGELGACPACRVEIRVEVFPAWSRGIAAGPAASDLGSDTEAACFYHLEKRAAVPCETCGRFLCSLCDIVIGERHLCPGCVDSGRRKGRLVEMENKRTLYDRLALMYAVIPILFWPATLITAPYVFVLCWRRYREPGCFVSPSKWRFWIAGVLASAQLIAWALFFGFLFTKNI